MPNIKLIESLNKNIKDFYNNDYNYIDDFFEDKEKDFDIIYDTSSYNSFDSFDDKLENDNINLNGNN
jgi:hypothetical protein